uniref:BHLH domain-containing protein n=1 Tax=Moniliophthora roreri TaxID=221103 RepID=A0A0W0F121_MONRR
MSLSTSSSSPTMNSESSKSRNSASLSPQLSNDTNLGLDPSDPLNLWLHDTSQGSDSSMDDSSAGESPPDWSQLSTLWPPSGESGANGKMEGVDFSMTLGSDMDFVNSMVIDPNALHFNYDGISPNELLPGQHYPFTFQSDGPTTLNVNDLTLQRERKLSITSSSSSSGASFSPIISSPVVPGQLLNHLEPRLDDPAAELAQRVRQIAGVTLAVPMGAHIQQATSNGTMSPQHSIVSGSPMSSPSTLFTSPSQSFMSMQAPSPSAYPSSSSATSSAPSTPPPTTPPPSAQLAVNAPASISTQAQQPSMGVISRPKTSHTTIERRYRTNLNARITSLRMAVPALRVLEDKEGTGVGGGGKKGKNSTLGKAVQFGTKVKKENEDGSDVIDVIDERGFVDGVKVARKCSKANVLGKAVEYIRVLKKREMRLKREQDGLKQLISGLVGGPALLREWEREWRAKFGGEEKDEVEGEDMDDGASDDDSGEDEDDEDGGRKRKKPKISPPPKELKEKKPAPPPPQPTVLPDGTVIMPEKLVVPNPGEHTLNFQPNMAPQPIQSQQQQQPAPTQYLLAVFALFSFFNSPFTSSSSPAHAPPNHSHTGTVLTHDATPIQPIVHGWTWHEIIQAFHLLVSALVFCSIVLPWLPVPSTKYFSFSYLSSLSASYRERARSRSNSAALRTRSAALREALSKRGSVCEANELRNALGSDVGVVKSLKGLIGLGKKENFTYQQKGLEQSAWVRLGELCVLGGETDAINRALTFWHMRAHLPWFTSSAADLSTLALVLYPLARFARRPAKAIWDAARARKGYSGLQEGGVGVLIRPHERLVLETMNIDEAVKFLEENPAPSERARYSPIGVLAGTLVKRRIKSYLQKSFVKTVLSSEAACDLEDDSVPVVDVAKSVTEEEEEERQVRVTIDAARSLGGRFSEMGEMLENIWTMGTCELDASEENDDDEESLENEIQALFNALVLYRRIFSSSIMGPGNVSSVSILLSPPPSPSRHDNKLHMSLRRALGSSVFESDDTALEDARDRVVDMLVECERARR